MTPRDSELSQQSQFFQSILLMGTRPALANLGFTDAQINRLFICENAFLNILAIFEFQGFFHDINFCREKVTIALEQHDKNGRDELIKLIQAHYNTQPVEEEKVEVETKQQPLEKRTAEEQKAALEKLGYNEEQTNKLLIRTNKKSVNAVINYTPTLTKPPYGYTLDEMTKLAMCSGGAENIEGVFDYHEELGFGKKYTLRLAMHNGGSENLKTVCEEYDRLIQAGLQHSEEDSEIIQIAGRAGGAKNVRAFLAYKTLLIDELKFEIKQVVKMLSLSEKGIDYTKHGGSQNIKLIAKYKHEREEVSINRGEITKLLMKGKKGREEFVKLIKKKKEDKNALMDLGFAEDQIKSLFACQNGSVDVEPIQDQMEEMGLSCEEMIVFLKHNEEEKREIEAKQQPKEQKAALEELGYNEEQINKLLTKAHKKCCYRCY